MSRISREIDSKFVAKVVTPRTRGTGVEQINLGFIVRLVDANRLRAVRARLDRAIINNVSAATSPLCNRPNHIELWKWDRVTVWYLPFPLLLQTNFIAESRRPWTTTTPVHATRSLDTLRC